MRQFREILLSEPGFAGLVDFHDWEREIPKFHLKNNAYFIKRNVGVANSKSCPSTNPANPGSDK